MVEDATGGGMVQRCPCRLSPPPMSEALALAGVPERERTFTAEAMTAPQRAIADHVHATVDSGESILLMGPVGRGKTGVAVCELIRSLKAGRSGRWCRVGDWLRQLRAQFDAPAGERVSEEALLRDLHEADLLIIDDLGAEYLTDWTRSMVHALVDGRDSSARPFIATTNLPLASPAAGAPSIESVYGARVASRLSRCARRSMGMSVPDLRARGPAGAAG
ncbi:MAG: ATP-binding protein [Dehalococcoidia bacterium]